MSGVGLVAMPWAAPDTPSIQIGVLTALARQSGVPVSAHSMHLEAPAFFADHGVDPVDYDSITHRWWSVGLGEWIFSESLRRTEADVDEYLRYLRRNDVPRRIVDVALAMRILVPSFLEHARREILQTAPALVGFTTTFSQTVPSLALARLIKERQPDVVVVFGGANCDGELGAALHRSFDVVDVVVQGEAEPIFAQLCDDIVEGRPLAARPGVLVRSQGDGSGSGPPAHAPVASSPTPDYDEYFGRLERSPLREALSPRARLVIETARGCWWGERNHCTFCGLNGTSMEFRSKPAGQVLEEISTLARRHRRVEFDVVDNILDTGYFDDVLPALAEQRRAGFDYRFFYETKANLTPRHLRLLREAGVHRIQPGIESLSTPVLRRMRKGVTALQNVRLLVFAARYDLLVTWNIIYGIPGETDDDYATMAAIVPSLTHLKPPGGLVRLQVHRFSPYFDEPDAHGLRLVRPAAYYPHLYDVSDDALAGLAYVFDHAHVDGHDPERAAAPLRHAVEEWDRHWSPGSEGSLRYERGPGFLRIRDRRGTVQHRDIRLDEIESELYLACLTGATARAAAARVTGALGAVLHADDVEKFLIEMTDARLMFREGNSFLALALPLTPDADPPQIAGRPWKLTLAPAS